MAGDRKPEPSEKELRERQRALRRAITARSAASSKSSSVAGSLSGPPSGSVPPARTRASTNSISSTRASSGAGASHGLGSGAGAGPAGSSSGAGLSTSATPSTATTSPHSLTFRVMRLCVPTPSRRPNLLRVAPGDHDETTSALGVMPKWEGEGSPCGIGGSMVLPQSFGSIYAGETFCACVCVYNRAVEDVAMVTVTLELHQNEKLYYREPSENISKTAIFASKTSMQRTIQCRLREVGVHVLVCLAEYTDHRGEVRILRQYFRFNVMAPLKFAVTVTPVPADNYETSTASADLVRPLVPPTHFLVSLKLTNATQGFIVFQDVLIEPSSAYRVEAVKSRPQPPAGHASLRLGCGTSDSHAFTFLAVALQNDGRSAEGAGPGKTIGRPSVRWRGLGGQDGELLRVGCISEPAEPEAELLVTIDAVPARIEAQRPFVARCMVQNNTDEVRRLYLQIRRDMVGEVVPVGVSGKDLGELPGRAVRETSLTLLPFSPGKHRISGVRVVDVDTRKSCASEPPDGPEVLVV